MEDSKFYNQQPEIFNNEIEKFADGANVDSKQTPYYGASDVCQILDTFVPTSMADEQRKFNDFLKAFLMNKYKLSVEQFVAKKLHYNSVADLCNGPSQIDYSQPNWRQLMKERTSVPRFAQEQIDAIATAIYSHEERGDAIILADQTGVGKGRVCAGLLRYAMLELKDVDANGNETPKKPFFFTEKKHLITDIYRDLIDIGLDFGVPKMFVRKEVESDVEYTDEQIMKYVRKDIKDYDGEIDENINYSFPEDFDTKLLLEKKFKKDKNGKVIQVEIDESLEEMIDDVIWPGLIDAYRQYYVENGRTTTVPRPNIYYDEQIRYLQKEDTNKRLLKPFFPNNVEIYDGSGNILYEKMSNKERDTILDTLELPSDITIFMIPYSVISTAMHKGAVKPSIKIIQKYSKNNVFILDESHTISGDSARFRIAARLLRTAGMVTYVSATYAKRANNMPLYAIRTSMKESGLTNKEMIVAFSEGKVALQEAVSVELTRNGQILRREKKIQGRSDYFTAKEGTEVGDTQIGRLDVVAELFGKVLMFQGLVRDEVNKYRLQFPSRKQNGALMGSRDEYKHARDIKALTFQLFNFFLLGLKVKQTVDFAINGSVNETTGEITGGLMNGRKTVITVANTMESALNNMPKDFTTNQNVAKYVIGDVIENDFKLYIAYLLNYTMRWTSVYEEVSDVGVTVEKSKTIYALDEDDELSNLLRIKLSDTFEATLIEIMETQTAISISPIDVIKKQIKNKGYSVQEITGRQRCIEFENNDFSKGYISKRQVKKTIEIIREFNENKIDCLIINQSGAVGVSMHAVRSKNGEVHIVHEPTISQDANGNKIEIENAPTSLLPKDEVKKRAMIITQMELNINTEVQKLGRISRTGQVYSPEFIYIVSAIPSEARLMSMMEKKLRSLSANTSAEQTQSAYLFESEDFYSDVAIDPFKRTLAIMKDTTAGRETVEDIIAYTKILYFRAYDIQKLFYDTFSEQLNNEIIELKKKKMYFGALESRNYKAQTTGKYPFYIGNENSTTSFGRHATIESAECMIIEPKNNENDIADAIKNRLTIDSIDDNYNVTTKQYSDISKYVTDVNKRLIEFSNVANEIQRDKIKSYDEEIANDESGLLEQKEKLKEFANLERVLELEELVKIESDAVNFQNELYNKLESRDKFGDKGREIGNQIILHEDLLKDYRAQLEKLGDSTELKRTHKSIVGSISAYEDSIERSKRRKERAQKKLNDKLNLVKDISKYIEKIGWVFIYEELKESISYENEEGEVEIEPQKFTYTTIFSQPCVVTGIEFPSNLDIDDYIPSAIKIYATSITKTHIIALSSLENPTSEVKISKGEKAIHNLSLHNGFYKGLWNDIAGGYDTSKTETKWFVVGTLLKTFILSRDSGMAGTITKYTTSELTAKKENKTKLGIEILDNTIGQKSVYADFKQRYATETSLQYIVYFDGNEKNIDIFITKYIYQYLIGGLKQKVEAKDKDLNVICITKQEADYNQFDFLFQISCSEGFIAVEVRANQSIMAEVKNAMYEINNNSYDSVAELMSLETFKEYLIVKFISDNVNVCDAFAEQLNYLGVAITENNYQLASVAKKENRPEFRRDVEKSPYGKSKKGADTKYLKKRYFCTKVTTEIALHNNEVVVSAKLSMTYQNFIDVCKSLEIERQRPSFATGSAYFETVKDNFVLEQFVETAEIASANQIDFEQTDINAHTSKLIDELVIILSK